MRLLHLHSLSLAAMPPVPDTTVRSTNSIGGLALNILVVEDSKRLQESLKRGLTGARFTVDVAGDGIAACLHLDSYSYELMVLDLGLPRKDGMAVLRHMRNCKDRPRVLVLSARDQVADRVGALNEGADDYLVKPFAFEELLARLHALSRRPHQVQPMWLSIGALSLNSQAHSVEVSGAPLPLTPREFTLLELLLRHRGRVFSRNEILDRVAGSDSTVSDRSVEVQMFGLRRKLERAGIYGLVENRRNAGYLIP